VDVSLQGPRAEIHDHHTRAPGSFIQTLSGVKAARRLGLEVGMTTVITRSNFRHLAALAGLASRAGAVRLHLAMARPLGEGLRLAPRVIPPPELVAPHLEAARGEARARGIGLTISGTPDRPDEPPGGDGEDLFAGLGWTAAQGEPDLG